MKNYYHILGVTQTATPEEIKSAYRKLSKKFHPDVNEGDTFFAARFREVQEAYDVLVDEQKRKAYDARLILYNRGVDSDVYEALKKRREEKKNAEELKRKEEEERKAEEERQRAEEELRWYEETMLRRKRRRTVAGVLVALAIVVVAGFAYYQYTGYKKSRTVAQQDSVAVSITDTLQENRADSILQPVALKKDRRLRQLNGRWQGTIYQFTTKEDIPIVFSCNASAGRFTVSYPSKGCRGKWEVIRIDSLNVHFQETITRGEDSCTQGGKIVLSQFKRGQYQYSYYWPNEKTLNASGILFRR